MPELAPRLPTDHPLTLKGYEIGPASKLHVGDVFEFVWANAPEFQWEWQCLGYNRFIVLRHSETYPHHCVCIPICTGGPNKHAFAKPGIDSFQQGFVFANGDPNPGYEQPKGGFKLQYSPVGIELRPGRLRIKEDSRANYADVINIEPNAHVLVVGDVVRYFDRVRRNVNKAYMRQILRRALEKYQAEKDEKDAMANRPASAAESIDGGAICRQLAMEGDAAETFTLNEVPTDEEERDNDVEQEALVKPPPPEVPEKPHRHRRLSPPRTPRAPYVSSSSIARLAPEERQDERGESQERLAAPRQSRRPQEADYDLRSMHKVALAGVKP